jgi:hypothetical protein
MKKNKSFSFFFLRLDFFFIFFLKIFINTKKMPTITKKEINKINKEKKEIVSHVNTLTISTDTSSKPDISTITINHHGLTINHHGLTINHHGLTINHHVLIDRRIDHYILNFFTQELF